MSDKKIQILIYILMLILAFLVGTLLYDATLGFLKNGVKPSNALIFIAVLSYFVAKKRKQIKSQTAVEIKPEASLKKPGIISNLFNSFTGSVIPTAKEFFKKDGPNDKK